jgi:hypothetical protein
VRDREGIELIAAAEVLETLAGPLALLRVKAASFAVKAASFEPL